jgi:hypothetical protein
VRIAFDDDRFGPAQRWAMVYGNIFHQTGRRPASWFPGRKAIHCLIGTKRIRCRGEK